MNWVLGTPRVWVTMLLAVGATACAARGVTPASISPSPFPTPPSPVLIPTGAPQTLEQGAPADVLQTALGLQGVRYSWGGDNPSTGFDCSGFVKYVLAQHLFPAPRTAAEQFHLGTGIDRTEIRAGDLVFFSTIAPGASHVGMALNADEFVHAPASNGVVRIDAMGSSYWRSRFVGARRILLPSRY